MVESEIDPPDNVHTPLALNKLVEPPSRRWRAFLEGAGAAFCVLAAETTLLWIVEQGGLLPMATGTSIPIYLAAGAAGGIPASAGGARSVIVLSLSYVVERSVRSAPQLHGFAVTHDPSVLDLVVSQTISLIAATVLAAMATRWAVREPPRSDALAISGSCFLGSLLALVELRASTIGIHGPPAAPPIAVLAALAIAPGLVIAVAASRRRISVRSQFVGASLVAITTGTTVIAELRGGIEPAFAVTASAPLLCGASVALAAVVIRSVDWGLVSRRAN